METCDLTNKKCKPCEGGVPPLTDDQVTEFMKQVSGWARVGNKIEKKVKFKDFVENMKFVNKLADVAESEGHHPDLFIHYNELTITLWTHAIGGLSENDFIVAAKADELLA